MLLMQELVLMVTKFFVLCVQFGLSIGCKHSLHAGNCRTAMGISEIKPLQAANECSGWCSNELTKVYTFGQKTDFEVKR